MKRTLATLLLVLGATSTDLHAAGPLGRTTASAGRVLLPFAKLTPADAASFQLGLAVFNTQWVEAGVAGAQRRDGLGPLFDSAACDACHNSGSRGQGPDADGPLPQSLVLQLGSLSGAAGGDPVYGEVLSRSSTKGFAPEGRVAVRYAEQSGQYPDGLPWRLRVPQIELGELASGPLDPATVLKPRLAPAIFGVGLLESVPESALLALSDPADRDGDGISGRISWQHHPGGRKAGRLGWGATATSVREQTSRAFARDMGLSSNAAGESDCGGRGQNCGDSSSSTPEVSDDLLAAIVGFQRTLGVPTSPAIKGNAAAEQGKKLFETTGCAGCHRPRLPVRYRTSAGGLIEGFIEPFTDMLLHDLGPELADKTTDGRVAGSEWRTAPLWGHRANMRPGRAVRLLHDGRARSVTEAILWHGGEALLARDRFVRLSAVDRATLADWVSNL